MITEEHLSRLTTLRMRAAADYLKDLIDTGRMEEMTIDECVIAMIEAEECVRATRKINKLNKAAGFACAGACIEELVYLPERSLDRGYVERLSSCNFLKGHDHIVVISETGGGKSYFIQALGNAACRKMKSVRYVRHPDLCKELNIARKNGGYYDLMEDFIKCELLIIDDFFTSSVPEANVVDTFEIIEARVDKGSMIIASLIEPDQWHLRIKTETLADSIVDRIVHRAHYIDIKGPNMREYLAKKKKEVQKG